MMLSVVFSGCVTSPRQFDLIVAKVSLGVNRTIWNTSFLLFFCALQAMYLALMDKGEVVGKSTEM